MAKIILIQRSPKRFRKKKKTSLAQYVRQRSIKTLLTQITINKYEKMGKDDKG